MKEGWKICKIGDIAHIRRGLTYSKSDEVDNSNNIVLRSNNIDLSTNKLVYDELKFIHQSINIPEDKYLKKGELLMCMSNGSKVHLGKVALHETDSRYVFGGFMAAISHDNSLIDKFFFYSLITSRFKEYIKSLSDGANINNLKSRDIENYTIPIPPLHEQERIVSLLDAEFAKIDAIKANAEKQLQDAKALFQSALKDLLTSNEGWKYTTLGKVSVFRRGLTYSKSDESSLSKNIVLRSNNVDLFTHQLTFDEIKYLKDDFVIPEDKYLKKGELLMCMSNGSKIHLGKVALAEQDLHFAFGGFMAAISHNEELLDKFFYYVLISPRFKEYIQKLSDGANINNIKVKDLEKFCFTFPSHAEQERIATSLDKFNEKIKSLQQNYEQTITLCNNLKQSILKDIFG